MKPPMTYVRYELRWKGKIGIEKKKMWWMNNKTILKLGNITLGYLYARVFFI